MEIAALTEGDQSDHVGYNEEHQELEEKNLLDGLDDDPNPPQSPSEELRVVDQEQNEGNVAERQQGVKVAQ